MRVEMKKWEVERIKEIVSEVLELWSYDFIGVKTESGRSMSMNKQTFLERLENKLLNNE